MEHNWCLAKSRNPQVSEEEKESRDKRSKEDGLATFTSFPLSVSHCAGPRDIKMNKTWCLVLQERQLAWQQGGKQRWHLGESHWGLESKDT